MLFIPLVVQLIYLLHHTAVLGLVNDKLSVQIEQADFSFTAGKDPGPRDIKQIVIDYFKYYGLPLEGGRYGLVIVRGANDMLDIMTSRLKSRLDGCESPNVIRDILLDVVGTRPNVAATTENDYTHSLHGMFMIVVNWVLKTRPFRDVIGEYLDSVGGMIDIRAVPALGAQRSATSVNHCYFLPDWIVSFPAKQTKLQTHEILSTVEFKMGGSAYHTVCDLQDNFYDMGGTVVAVWEPGTKGGVVHYIPAGDLGRGEKVSRYDTMLDRIMEAAATATWSDTKLTLFMASERYFAAGPARGHGLAQRPRNPQQNNKRDDQDDEGCTNPNGATPKEESDRAEKVASVRKAFRQSQAAVVKALFNEVYSKATVDHKVIYLPTYGTEHRPATFISHVLALTMDKLLTWAKESVLELDHSASASKMGSLGQSADGADIAPPAPSRPPKKAKLGANQP